jgi:poly(A) polymerase
MAFVVAPGLPLLLMPAADSSEVSSFKGLPPCLQLLLPLLIKASDGARIALVGGALRDLLLHRLHSDPRRGLTDLDLVVEARPSDLGVVTVDDHLALAQVSPAHQLVERLLAGLDPAVVSFCAFHHAYGTAELALLPKLTSTDTESVLLDVATARAERYPVPAENPHVCFARLEDDLARRDFSVNAMALQLAPGALHLLDPHGGTADLAMRQLRFLHSGSVCDDPTRILRAARYGARLCFVLEPASLEQVKRTLQAWPWPWRLGDAPQQAPPALGTRLRMELELLLEREPWPEALTLLQRWGGMVLLDQALQADASWFRRIRWAERAGLPRLIALIAGAADPIALAARLQLPHRQQLLLKACQQLRHELALLDLEACASWTPSAWTVWLERRPRSLEAVPLALACGAVPRRPLLRWWLCWRHVDSGVRAQDLLSAGMEPGPALGQRLRELRWLRLDQLPPLQLRP